MRPNYSWLRTLPQTTAPMSKPSRPSTLRDLAGQFAERTVGVDSNPPPFALRMFLVPSSCAPPNRRVRFRLPPDHLGASGYCHWSFEGSQPHNTAVLPVPSFRLRVAPAKPSTSSRATQAAAS